MTACFLQYIAIILYIYVRIRIINHYQIDKENPEKRDMGYQPLHIDQLFRITNLYSLVPRPFL
jgi:hypothetical protein